MYPYDNFKYRSINSRRENNKHPVIIKYHYHYHKLISGYLPHGSILFALTWDPNSLKERKKKKNTATEKSFSTMGQHERKKERFEVMSGHWIGLSGSRIRRRGTGSRWSAPVSTSGVPVFACRFPIGRPRQNCPAGWFFSREKIRASVRTGRVGSGSR